MRGGEIGWGGGQAGGKLAFLISFLSFPLLLLTQYCHFSSCGLLEKADTWD